MKQWKLILVTLLAVLMVCVCTSAMAETCDKCGTHIISETAPTCTEPGKIVYDTCTDKECANYARKEMTVPATGHTTKADEYVIRTQPTCTTEGLKVWKCIVCKVDVRTESIPVKEHAWDEEEGKRVPATCLEDGSKWFYCPDCGAEKTEVIKAPGKHTALYVDTKYADCENAGYDLFKCACGYEEKRNPVAATGHDWELAGSQAATCDTDGYKRYECQNENCTKEKKDVLTKLGHDFSVVVAHQDPTCTEDGYDWHKCSRKGCEEKELWADRTVLTATGHNDVFVETKAPTCTKIGYDVYQCSECERYTGKNEVPMVAHNYTLIAGQADATCEEDGYIRYKCSVCEALQPAADVTVIPATGHTMTATAGHKDPTCTEDGYHRAKCAVCGELDEKVVLEKTGHHYTIKHAVNEPTCQKEGNTVYKCEDCNTYEARDIQPKVDHKFDKKGATKAPTCENDGYTWYHCTFAGCTETAKKDIVTKTGHNYVLEVNNLPTCQEKGSQVYVCYNAGCETKTKTVEIEKLPHQYSETQWTWVAEPNCTETGRKAYLCIMCAKQTKYVDVDALGHNFEGAKVIPFTGHDATCTEAGEGYQQCQNNGCTFVNTVVIEAKGHEFNEKYFYHKPATCTEDGLKKYACVRSCNGVHCEEIKYEPIPATGHTFEETVLVKPTCTTQGMKVITCEDCDYQKYELIAAAGHGKMVEVSKTPATCTEAGEVVTKCEVCGESVVEVIPATGHTNTKEEIVKAPTCTEAGSNKVVCTICGETVETKEVAALGHGATEEKTVKEATCTEAGSVEVICTVCGETLETEAVAALGHDMVAGAVKAPTCTEKGYTTYECSRCDVTEIKDETEALGHDLVLIENAVVATPAAPGEDHNACTRCDYFEIVKYNKYTKYYYENTLTSFGPTTEELLGEGDWYRVTPIDLSVDGIYTFDLIASNAYVVGTVTITVSEGVMTVSYDVNANHIEVLEEALVLYASKADLAEGKGVTVAFGEEINLAETFGEDSKVLVSLMLTGTYDAAGYGVYGFEADAEEIAELLAIVD